MSWTVEDWQKFKDLSPSQIQDLIEAEQPRYDPDSEYYGVSGGEVWDEWYDYETRTVEGLGTVTVLEKVGGGEGGGEYMHKIIRVSNAQGDHRFFQKPGWYQSYDGSHWDGDLFEVNPVQRTVTIWQKVNR